MPNDSFDAAVLIGRFQPFHNGHAGLLRAALARAEWVLLVLGSSFCSRNAKNPFTWQERAAMIAASLDEADARRVRFIPIRDYYDDRRWAKAVETGMQAEMASLGFSAPRLALAGFFKDASSYYLNLFPHCSQIELPQQGDIDATRIRRLYFEANASWRSFVPPPVAAHLEDWATRPAFATMQEEHRAIDAYRQKWGNGPFVTLDAVVTMAQHVLLVRRGHPPGKDQWAVPGGFLEGRERLLQGAIRELKEETGLTTADANLEKALREVAVFDHPDRSQRGRIITHAHWFDLSGGSLPAIAGADDAAEARWFPVADLPDMEAELFEDHFHILCHFLNTGFA